MAGPEGRLRGGRSVRSSTIFPWPSARQPADHASVPFDGGMYSVELVLDGPADAAVRTEWAGLRDAGLPSQARHTGSSNRPHVTLALAASASAQVQARLTAVAAELPLPVAVGAVLVFGQRNFVLARLVVPDAALLAVHRRVLTALDDLVDRHGTFAAGAWTPHVTLGRRLTAAEVGAALAVVGATGGPGSLTRLRLWDMSAHQEIWLG